ncbi:hypothetical protein [Gallaecimonas pentaromativorans]|uniref:Tetratricopeptide repeat protein n=1 Tax=Gallaecimonas pentaromativorans TaxID=584787 RepID=A0A3N1PBR7_9GAMM|nr:hypothetical protein [Gallaecimonas pentaromativorans]MED5524849.1 hypothetical protein [Pseudomonadota bacterium]ROQ28862.1 hypothetical protein EDC28_103459 [Gallaecimonas pentaromativorans]
MDEWKVAICAANHAFSQGEWGLAEHRYLDACHCVQARLAANDSQAEEVIAALVVSFANLAELYFQQGRMESGLGRYLELKAQLDSCRSHHRQCNRTQMMLNCAERQMGTQLLHALKTQGVAPTTSQQLLHTVLAGNEVAH